MDRRIMSQIAGHAEVSKPTAALATDPVRRSFETKSAFETLEHVHHIA